MQIKAIPIDHDGTLADSELAHFEIQAKVLFKYNLELCQAEYQSQYAGIATTTSLMKLFTGMRLKLWQLNL